MGRRPSVLLLRPFALGRVLKGGGVVAGLGCLTWADSLRKASCPRSKARSARADPEESISPGRPLAEDTRDYGSRRALHSELRGSGTMPDRVPEVHRLSGTVAKTSAMGG